MMRMKLKKIGKKCIARLLVVVLIMTCAPICNYQEVTAIEEEVLPFSLEATEKHVEDAEVIAKKLVLTSDNASIIDTGITDLVVVKEIVHSVQAKVYLVGSQGVLHTFLVDADDPWLEKLKARKIEGWLHTTNDALQRINLRQLRKDAFDDYSYTNYQDTLIKVLNPEGKYDLLNLSLGEYHSYSCDGFNYDLSYDSYKDCVDFIMYYRDGKFGFLDNKGEKKSEAKFTGSPGYISERVAIAAYYDESTEQYKYSLVSNDGIFEGTESYQKIWGVNYDWNLPYDYSYHVYRNGQSREENSGVVVEDFDDDYVYIDLMSGEKTSLYGDYIDVVGRMNNNVIAYKDKIVKDAVSGWYGDKAYLISGQKHIDLNDKLGGDFCDIKKIGRDEDVEEYMWVSAYSFVKESDGNWTTEYYYQGVIDSDGKKIYGSTLPEYWGDTILDFKGDYGIIKHYNSEDSNGQCQVIERGKQNPVYVFKNDYELSSSSYILGVAEDYIALSTKDILDIKNGKIIHVDNLATVNTLSVIFDSDLSVNGEQYAAFITGGNGHGVTIQNLVTGDKFERKEDGSCFRTMVKERGNDEKEKRVLFWIEGDESDTILNEKLKPVEHGKGSIIYISEDLYIVTNQGIYNYDGECILETSIDGYGVEKDEKGNGLLPAYYMEDGDDWYDAKYTFCDIKGNLLNDYKYEVISHFRKGIACVRRYDDNMKYALIDNSGNKLVAFDGEDISWAVCENYGVSHLCTNLEVNGEEFVLYGNKSAYIYDLTNVANRVGDLEDASYNAKEEQDYYELLEQAEEMEDIKLSGMKSTFKVPEEVPVIGGEDFDFDFSTIPIVAEKAGNTFRIGIGIEMKEGNLFSLKQNAWNNLKKNIESKNEDFLNGEREYKLAKKFGTLSTGLKKNVKGSIYGYAEGTISKGRVQSIQGMGVFDISFSVKKQWQKVVAYVPLLLSIKGGASVDATTSIGFDYSEKVVYTNGTVELELPEIKVAGGVGVISVGDASAYGGIQNVLSIDKDHVQDYVTGDMGVSLNFLCFSKEKSLWPYKRKVIYDSTGGIVTSGIKKHSLLGTEEEYVIDRSNQNNASDWKSDVEETGTASKMRVLQENTYTQSNPQIVALDDGTILMIHTADLSERKTGNHTALVYSLYNKEKRKWSEPEIVEDNGTADYYPTLATDGKTAYVAWVDSNSDSFSADASMEEVASSCEVKVAKFDTDTKTFVDSQALCHNDCADVMPSLTIKDGEAYIAWISNSENDILTLSGNNSVYYGHCKEGKWMTEKLFSQSLPIEKLKIGVLNDKIQIAYLEDKDGNVETTDDTEVNILDVLAPEKMHSHSERITDIEFASLGGEDALFVTGEKGLEYTKNADEYSVLLDTENGVCTQYNIVPSGDSTLILGSKASDKNSDIVGYIYEDGVVSSPIPITQQKEYINYMNGTSVGGDVYLMFKRDRAEFTDDSFEINSDLCMMTFSNYVDLGVSNFAVDEEVVPGTETSLNVVCKNVGMQDVASYKVEIRVGNEVIGTHTADEILKKGEEKALLISCDIPESLSPNSQLTASIICEGDTNSDNNSKSVTVGYPDLELSVHQFNSEGQSFAELFVGNMSFYDAEEVQVVLRKLNSTGDILEVYDLDNVEKGKRKKVKLTSADIQKLTDMGDSLYVEIISKSKEQYYTNNYGFLYLGKTEAQGIDLETSQLYFDKIGQKKKIEYTVYPEGAEAEMLFSSSNKNVVEVAEDGTVMAIGDGNATISLSLKDNEDIKASVYCEVNSKSDSGDTTATVSNQPAASSSHSQTVKKPAKVNKPGKVTGLKVKNKKKKKLVVSWKWKVNMSGFQIQYAQNAKFTKKKKSKMVGKWTSQKTITKLKKGKIYYVRVRAYKESSGKKIYGKWSKIKKIKIRK